MLPRIVMDVSITSAHVRDGRYPNPSQKRRRQCEWRAGTHTVDAVDSGNALEKRLYKCLEVGLMRENSLVEVRLFLGN
jgi:hypothetical protein